MAKRSKSRRHLGAASKKDYIAIGNILCRNAASPALVADISGYFREENPAFNPITFQAHIAKCKSGKR